MTTDKKALKDMLDAGCHFGHKTSKWNPKMMRYIFAKKEGIHIFDLVKTHEALVKAQDFLKDLVSKGKTVLFVSTKLQSIKFVDEAAKRCGCPFITRKWMPGILTNFDTIKKRIKYFRDLKQQRDSGEWEKYTKKERLELSRVIEKLEHAFSGVEEMLHLPDAVVVLDALHDALALREAKRLKIPTVAICDSNADPDIVTYPIPGNDDAIKSLRYFIDSIASAVEEGKKAVKK